MKSLARSSMRSLVATVLCTVAASGLAQTPAQLEYERQQREYWRQQEQQRQEQQRQQQIMQDNARRQQEESSRINAPAGQAPSGAAPGAAPARGGDPSGAQAASAARAMWEKRPALHPTTIRCLESGRALLQRAPIHRTRSGKSWRWPRVDCAKCFR
jgi:TolA-binding protein